MTPDLRSCNGAPLQQGRSIHGAVTSAATAFTVPAWRPEWMATFAVRRGELLGASNGMRNRDRPRISAPLVPHVDQIFALRPLKEVLRFDAVSDITVMADEPPMRDRTDENHVRNTMRLGCATVPGNRSVSVRLDSPSPKEASSFGSGRPLKKPLTGMRRLECYSLHMAIPYSGTGRQEATR